MPKLTDTQLVILTAAAKREDGTILPLPRRIKFEAKAATALFKTLIKRKLVAERSAKGSEPSWRESAEGERMTLTVTDAGLQAIGVEPDEKASSGRSKPRETTKPTRSEANPASGRSRGAQRSSAQGRPNAPRTGSKQDQLIGLLRRSEGATVEEMAQATGWQSHSVRGVMSGALKKKLGLAIASEKVEGRGRTYRIANRG